MFVNNFVRIAALLCCTWSIWGSPQWGGHTSKCHLHIYSASLWQRLLLTCTHLCVSYARPSPAMCTLPLHATVVSLPVPVFSVPNCARGGQVNTAVCNTLESAFFQQICIPFSTITRRCYIPTVFLDCRSPPHDPGCEPPPRHRTSAASRMIQLHPNEPAHNAILISSRM